MTKSRREQFEDQLRALQEDISHLSRRLGNPVVQDRHADRKLHFPPFSASAEMFDIFN